MLTTQPIFRVEMHPKVCYTVFPRRIVELRSAHDGTPVKRDMDLIRTVLFEVERLPEDGGFHDIPIPTGTTELEFYGHVRLAAEAGLLDAIDLTTLGGVCWKPKRLTWNGHEFLGAYRSDTAWQRGKELVVKSTGSLTFEGLKAAIPVLMKNLLGIG
jgi:hypothetical protein